MGLGCGPSGRTAFLADTLEFPGRRAQSLCELDQGLRLGGLDREPADLHRPDDEVGLGALTVRPGLVVAALVEDGAGVNEGLAHAASPRCASASARSILETRSRIRARACLAPGAAWTMLCRAIHASAKRR